MTQSKTIRLGTRGSKLARWQADHVTKLLQSAGYVVEQVLITTSGDVTTGSLRQSATQGFFTKEIQRSLLNNDVDLAVHSLKDLPTEKIDGLTLAAVPEREVVDDAFVSNQVDSIDALPEGARVGTGSTRRRSQLLHVRPDLNILEIRGNVDTRLAKLDDDEYDAIILASSGLRRLGLSQRICQSIPLGVMLPAVGQGALGLETRSDDTATREAVNQLNDAHSFASVTAERSLLAALRGGCLAPVAAWGRVESEELKLDAVVLSLDGQTRLAANGAASIGDAATLGERVAQDLIGQGAQSLITDARSD